MSFRRHALTVRRALTVAAFAGLSAVAACGSDSTGPSGDSYTLFSISGATVPIVQTDVSGTYTLKSGIVTLAKNGTYTVRITETFKPTGSALETYVYGENGTWALAGETLTATPTQDYDNGTLTASTSAPYTATKTATQITVDDGVDIYIFKK